MIINLISKNIIKIFTDCQEFDTHNNIESYVKIVFATVLFNLFVTIFVLCLNKYILLVFNYISQFNQFLQALSL